jgi:hypothetical protein
MIWQYPEMGKPKIRQAPDFMVVFGRPKGEGRSYKQWEEKGIAPQAAFKVFSPGNRFSELLLRFKFYDKYGVEEYYINNPDNGDSLGWQRGENEFEEVAEMNGHVSPRLHIRFVKCEDSTELKILDPDGRPLLNHQQLLEQDEIEHQRAGAKAQRAERLAAKLRELGIEAD